MGYNKGRKTIRIERRSGGYYSVVKDRGDGVAFSVGLTKNKREAQRLKKENAWKRRR